LDAWINNALRLTALVGIPSALVLYLLGEELCRVIFGYPEAGIALRLLAVGAPFLYLQQTTTGILQGLGKPLLPFRNLVVASVFKTTGIFLLTANPDFGIRGAALALVCGFAIMSLLNLLDLRQLTGCAIRGGDILGRPLIAALGAAGLLHLFWHHLANRMGSSIWGLLSGLLVAGIGYLVALIGTGGLHKRDYARFSYLWGKIIGK